MKKGCRKRRRKMGKDATMTTTHKMAAVAVRSSCSMNLHTSTHKPISSVPDRRRRAVQPFNNNNNNKPRAGAPNRDDEGGDGNDGDP